MQTPLLRSTDLKYAVTSLKRTVEEKVAKLCTPLTFNQNFLGTILLLVITLNFLYVKGTVYIQGVSSSWCVIPRPDLITDTVNTISN